MGHTRAQHRSTSSASRSGGRMTTAWSVVVAALIAVMSGPTTAAADDGVVAHGGAFVVSGSSGSGSSAATGGGPGGGSGAVVILEPVCVMAVSPISPQPGSGCLTLSDRPCPPGESFVRRWTASGGGWVQGDVTCADLRGVPTVAQIASLVADSVRHHVPQPRVGVQPAGRPLITLPVLLDSGQGDRPVVWSDVVAGIPVVTTVAATWRWDFGDGTTMVTSDAGSRWPDMSVSHTYRSPGRRSVRVTATWTGSFRLGSLGSQPIPGEVTQSDGRTIEITTAAARMKAVRDWRR